MRWTKVENNPNGSPTVLELDGVAIVRLIDRVDGTWFALLDYHLAPERHRRRDCTSFEAGRAGAETWARRHIARLLHEAAERRARWQVLRTPSPEERAARPPHFEEPCPPHPGRPRSRRRDHR